MGEDITPDANAAAEAKAKSDADAQALLEGQDVSPAGGDGAAQPTLTDKVNEALGKEFPNEDAALKAIKDTFAHVGDVGKLDTLKEAVGQVQRENNLPSEEAAIEFIKNSAGAKPLAPAPNEPDPNKFVSREEFEDEQFYGSHPELQAHKATIDAFRSKPSNQGKSLTEITGENGDADLKSQLEIATKHVEAEGSKSVLESSPRLGQTRDHMTKAAEASKEGDNETASKEATAGVIEAFDLDKAE